MNSGLILSRASDRPAYQQIIDQVKRRVASGDWKPGSEMPSIRGLALELRTSVITVRRAYLELEREGIVRTRQGRGSFIADEVAHLQEPLREEELKVTLTRAVELATVLGCPVSRVVEMLEKIDKELRSVPS